MINDLMRPRYKVIADYPYSPYKIGDLVEISNTGTSFHCTTTGEYDQFREDIVEQENYVSISKLSYYPHLFKKLEWWEERTSEEMPKYLKVYDEVKKVKMYGWFRGGESAVFENEEITKYLSHCIPATEEEYNAQQSPQTENKTSQ